LPEEGPVRRYEVEKQTLKQGQQKTSCLRWSARIAVFLSAGGLPGVPWAHYLLLFRTLLSVVDLVVLVERPKK
jgi:hypothetical protein